MASAYHFITIWRVAGSAREVADILGEAYRHVAPPKLVAELDNR